MTQNFLETSVSCFKKFNSESKQIEINTRLPKQSGEKSERTTAGTVATKYSQLKETINV